ncbi:TonB-dependent siderophore receptor [Sphingomonas elodea]|uniref:Putative ferrichrome-iron receptor n=1 Tax=Sphingomonas elodea TaxID=179878 RepID=Q7X2M9_SPHEL|nr:TonB-dependent siderophore receptor [Sphingomonas elodea]AAP57680.1 putative ferrichrome-iron receptor [Sphingomonas elodea ATCC 31461]
MTLATAALLSLGAILPAAAEEREPDPDSAGQEIVVLGTRAARTERTLSADPATERMSQSSRALERDLLTAAGTYRLSDALELISGVSNQNNRGGVMDNFAIRGFLGTPDGGAEYYVDGFLANRGMAPPRDPATTERIELLKGPMGALFGDADPGGRVNLVSKTPGAIASGTATLTYGSFNTRRVEVDVNQPITTTLAARLVAAGEDSDGWRDFVTLKRRVVAPSLTWRPSDSAQLTYVGEITRFDTPFDRGMPAIGGNANALPRSRYFGEPANGVTRFRNERHQLTGEVALGGGWALNGGVAWRTGSLRGFSADQSRLVNGTTLWRQRRQRGYTVDDLSARMELAGRVGRHQLSFGAKGYLLDYHELLLRRSPSAAAPYAIDVFAPVYGGTALPLLPFTDNREKRWAATFYVQDLWEVADRVTLSGGVRYDPYRQRIHNVRTGAVGRAVDDPVHFRVGAQYRLDTRFALHANWGENFVLNSGTGRDGSGFAPEAGKGYELGASVRLPGVALSASWFSIEKRNILTNDPVDPNFNAPVGRLRSHGIEFDGSARLGRHWQLVANYAWTHARTLDRSFATDRVLDVPAHAGTLFVLGSFLDADGRGPSISGGLAYVGDRAGAIDGSGLILPSYVKAKAAAEYALSRRMTLRLEADNLFDARYAMSSYSSLWVYPGAPRTVRASLRVGY